LAGEVLENAGVSTKRRGDLEGFVIRWARGRKKDGLKRKTMPNERAHKG